MTDYQIIKASSLEQLATKVVDFINANPGYLPAGGPVFFHQWCQAVYI